MTADVLVFAVLCFGHINVGCSVCSPASSKSLSPSAYLEFQTAKPPSKEAVIEWFRSSEISRRAGFEPNSDQLAPWFHGEYIHMLRGTVIFGTIPIKSMGTFISKAKCHCLITPLLFLLAYLTLGFVPENHSIQQNNSEGNIFPIRND